MSDPGQNLVTLTVIGSGTVLRPDGRAAISLQTQERGTIAFEVTLQAIEALRKQLTTAETFLRQSVGKA